MIILNVTDFARNMKHVLNQVEYRGEEVLLVRNKRKLARIRPEPFGGNALEVLSDIYRTLPETAAAGWEEDYRIGQSVAELRDPWAT
jgi:hypothetical protein